jgi:hypothetical protein
MVAEEASVELHVNVVLSPALIAEGETAIVTVGTPGLPELATDIPQPVDRMLIQAKTTTVAMRWR